MLPERKARSCSHDAARGTARLEVGGAGGAARDVAATVLLDKQGKLVGVDVDPDGARTVVMVGRHEDVASTRPAKVSVSRSKDGEVATVVVSGLK